MVARLSQLSALRTVDTATAPDSSLEHIGSPPTQLALRGQLLLERASSLAGVQPGGRGITGIAGMPLHLAAHSCRNKRNAFIRDRVFAVISGDGSMCLRLPDDLADDLVDNGLCIRLGKNLLTWVIENEYQLEVNWRILLHAYWNVTSTSRKHTRWMLSEFVIQH